MGGEAPCSVAIQIEWLRGGLDVGVTHVKLVKPENAPASIVEISLYCKSKSLVTVGVGVVTPHCVFRSSRGWYWPGAHGKHAMSSVLDPDGCFQYMSLPHLLKGVHAGELGSVEKNDSLHWPQITSSMAEALTST